MKPRTQATLLESVRLLLEGARSTEGWWYKVNAWDMHDLRYAYYAARNEAMPKVD